MQTRYRRQTDWQRLPYTLPFTVKIVHLYSPALCFRGFFCLAHAFTARDVIISFRWKFYWIYTIRGKAFAAGIIDGRARRAVESPASNLLEENWKWKKKKENGNVTTVDTRPRNFCFEFASRVSVNGKLKIVDKRDVKNEKMSCWCHLQSVVSIVDTVEELCVPDIC